MLDDFRSQKLIWNMANNKIYEKIEAHQGDSNGRKLVVQITNSNVVDDLEGASLSLAWSRKENQGLDAFTEVNLEKGIFEIYYTTEMLSNVGVLKSSLVLVDVNGRIESKPFDIDVMKSSVDDDAIQSENSFTALTEALIKVSQYQAEIDDIKKDITDQGSTLITQQGKRFNDLHNDKENKLDRLYDDKKSNLEDLYSDKNKKLDNLYNTKETKLDNLHDTKETELENIRQDYIDKAANLEETYAPRLGKAEEDIDELMNSIEKLDKIIETNVIAFGAKGDGVTDDSKSIQDALDYVENSGGGIVNMPAGEYILADALHIGSNVSLIGSGKTTILNANKELESGSSTIYNKGRGGSETYDGASNFSIENLSIISTTRNRQGLYFDNAVDFRVSNIWGLGKTLDHYIDINNSKNGLFENVYLTYDPQGTAPFQIDSREGMNDGIIVRNLQVTHPNYKFDPDNIQSHDAAIHFHRVGANNIDISNVTIRGMNVGIYKDPGCVLKNVRFTNFKMINCSQPINFTNSGDTRQKDIIIKDWIVESSRLNRPFGYFIDIDNLTIEDISIQTNQVEKEHAIRLSKCSKVKIGGIEFSGDYKPTEEGKPLSFIRSSDSDYSITKSITGHWLPEVGVSGKSYNVEYSRQFGAYTIIGNMIHLTGRLTIKSVGTNDSGYAYILNPPAPILADSRPAGSIGLGSRFKGEAENLVISGADLGSGDVLRIHPAMTDEFIDIRDLDDSFFAFSISYIFE